MEWINMTLTVFAFIVTVVVSFGFGFLSLRKSGRRESWLEELEATRVPVTRISPRKPME
jgi:hypothetical protein